MFLYVAKKYTVLIPLQRFTCLQYVSCKLIDCMCYHKSVIKVQKHDKLGCNHGRQLIMTKLLNYCYDSTLVSYIDSNKYYRKELELWQHCQQTQIKVFVQHSFVQNDVLLLLELLNHKYYTPLPEFPPVQYCCTAHDICPLCRHFLTLHAVTWPTAKAQVWMHSG